jgi:hypothetical protein
MMKRFSGIFAAIALSALPALAGSPFKTALVGPEPTAICLSKTSILTYQQNRVGDPLKASAALSHCRTLAPGSKVEVIYIFGDGVSDHVVQVHPLESAKLGYALTSGFAITQEVGSAN